MKKRKLIILITTLTFSLIFILTGCDNIIEKTDSIIWGFPLIFLILSTGILLTVKTKFVQIRHFKKAFSLIFEKDEGQGEISGFEALCTSLSASIGTGNIIGVATAISAGGAGALFWMLLAAFFGMATKYAEGFLSVKYRKIEKNHAWGGPFIYIEQGISERFPNIPKLFPKSLSVIFAVSGLLAGLLGIGTMTQSNGITSSVKNFFDKQDINSVSFITAIIITFFSALIIIGGIKRISKFSAFIVPLMAGIYLLFATVLIILNISKVPFAIKQILKSAFTLKACSGALYGHTIKEAIRYGVSRGIFSNESGLGSAPIASASAKTDSPVKQGLILMTGTFIDTFIVCSLTGISVILSGSYLSPDLKGLSITEDAFNKGLMPLFGEASEFPSFILMLCLIFFAFTTIIGWNFYSKCCLEYLINGRKHKEIIFKIFNILYISFVFFGSFLSVDTVWNVADIFNAFMVVPNIIGLLLLSGVVAKETSLHKKL